MREVNGWPLDFVGFVGLRGHDERDRQPDFWQITGYIKGYWHGFPWSDLVGTRLGVGAGVSYAARIPAIERDEKPNGRTSRLLNYLDPSVDVNVGDLLGVRALRGAYLGLGISHRSGVFGISGPLGNVAGGSNFIYTYIEFTI